MKKTFKLIDLDCANCAAKMENAVSKINGVNSVSISFIMQKMTLDLDEANTDNIIKEIKSVCRRVEPDCKLKI